MATTAAILEYIVTANTAQANAALAKTQGQLVTMGKTSKASGAAAKAGFAAVGAAAIAAGVAVFKVGEEFDKAYDKIRSQTGATGKEAEKLEKSFRNVLKTVPTDFDSAATAVAGLNQRLGETGKPLTELARQITALAKITGEDVQENVEAVTRLFGDWQVATKDQTDTLDGLFRISQKTGATVSDLARNMVQFGAPLRNLGFDLDQAAAMFGAFEKTGVNITTVLSGLRLSVGNFAKPSDDLAKTMERLNLSAKDTPAAISAMFKEIKTLKSESEATALAIDAFGKRAGPDLVDTIRGGKFELNDLLKTFRSGDGTIRQAERSTRDFGEQWTLFKNRIATVIEPVAVAFFELVGKGMKAIAKIDFKGAIKSLQDFWNSAGILRDVIKAVTGFVLERFRNMIDFLKSGVKLISSILTGDFRGMWDAIKGIFRAGVSAVLAPVKAMIGIVRDIGRRIGDAMADVFGGAWDKVKGVFESGANAVIGFLNFIISALNRIPGVDIGEIGGVGGGGGGKETGSGNSANATEEHFRGGKVTAPRAIVGEEAPAHPEYVLATNPAYRQRNLRLWQEAGGKLGVPGFARGGQLNPQTAGQTVLASASDIISKFPSTDSLPGWLKDTGDYALKKAAAFARDKVKNLVESASEAITGGMTSGIENVGGAGYEKIVAMGKQLQAQNFLVAGHPAFPPVGTHTAGSNHYIGRAIDVNWADAATEPAKLAPLYNRLSSTNPLELYFQNRGIPAPVSDHYDHLHLAYKRGGILGGVPGFLEGGVVGRALPSALQKFNHVYPKSYLGRTGSTMPEDRVAMLAEFFGMPGVTMAQISRGESVNHHPGAIGDDAAAGYGNTFGLGLWQITTGVGHDSLIAQLGGQTQMLNPITNAIAARELWQASGISPWLGTRYVTGSDLHWNGDFGKLTRAGEGGGRGGAGGRAPDPTRGQGGIVGFLDSPWAQAATGGRGGGGSSGGTTYTPADIPKKVQDMLTAYSGAIALLDTQIMLAEHFSSYNSSEAGADLGPLEVAEQLFLHQQLLTNLEGLRNWATRGLGLKRTSNKGKKALAGLLPGLVGDSTSVGRILETKKRIDELQHPEFSTQETEGQQFLAEYFKSEALKANQRFAVSQAQYKVFRDFAGGFAGGGYIPQGKWGVVGESGPEVVGGPSTVAQMGGEGVSVIVNGDIVNTPPGMQPVEVRGAKTIVQQGSRGYGRRPLGGAKGY